MNENEKRSPEEIESDIERTRADFSSTIEAIQHKLSPSEMMGNAKEYALSTTPGAFSVNLINTIRDNPIPVALIGIGVAWLMRAERRPRYDTGYSRGRGAAYYTDMDSAYEDEFATGYGAGAVETGDSQGVMQRAKMRTSDAARGIRDKASDVGQRLSGTASSVSSRLSSTASSMSGRMQESAQTARARMSSTAQTASARMSEMGRRSQEQYYRARERAGQLVDEQPLVIAALGVAVGAALGATLPRTQRENELMGSVRDDLLDRAKETAREQAEVLKQSAQRVADTAKQEAGRVQEQVSSGVSQGSGSRGTEGAQFGGTTGQPSIH
ncbi:DUF3618 domain-containing protein [Noviherbaspirillum aridicola]|uniref:DUF3618 domain-containing protein n=1 Tax=Noviherbaspirillum aridicola TaxID=2849687 RepID=A0ABQ4Q058_9BURK|nr:DUF3618 domain-containing protein [Noviherbaspirillum aridicola]GIZ50392.1 hypothetical protein NCCP691_04060 [Noviherbaspirillum aridicola]